MTGGPAHEVDTFVASWTHATDRFLASGFINPTAFVETVDRLGLSGDFTPSPGRAAILGWVYACGHEDTTCTIDILLDGMGYMGVAATRSDVESVVYAYGSAANIETFGRWVWEHGVRVMLYRQWSCFIEDQRPVGVIARELLEAVAHVR